MTKVVNNFITRPLCHAIPWRTYRNPNICHHPREGMLYTRSFIHGIHGKETGKGNQVSSMSAIVGWKDISNIQSNTYAPPPLPAHLNIGVPPYRCSVCDSLSHTLSVFVKCSWNSLQHILHIHFAAPILDIISFQASLWLIFFSSFPIIIIMLKSDAWCCFWNCVPSSSINNRQHRPHRIKGPWSYSIHKNHFPRATWIQLNYYNWCESWFQHTMMKTENKKK